MAVSIGNVLEALTLWGKIDDAIKQLKGAPPSTAVIKTHVHVTNKGMRVRLDINAVKE